MIVLIILDFMYHCINISLGLVVVATTTTTVSTSTSNGVTPTHIPPDQQNGMH